MILIGGVEIFSDLFFRQDTAELITLRTTEGRRNNGDTNGFTRPLLDESGQVLIANTSTADRKCSQLKWNTTQRKWQKAEMESPKTSCNIIFSPGLVRPLLNNSLTLIKRTAEYNRSFFFMCQELTREFTKESWVNLSLFPSISNWISAGSSMLQCTSTKYESAPVFGQKENNSQAKAERSKSN